MNPPLVIFVAMPASDMGPHATWVDTAEIKHYLYDPVAEQVAAALGTEVDLRIEKDKISQGAIHRSMFNEALQAPIYIADLTGANANVYLELGVRWALRDHVTVLVCQNLDQDIKFNVAVNRVIRYGREPTELESARRKIANAILEGLERRHVDSPVRQSLGAKEIYSEIARLREERVGGHAPGDQLWRSFGAHIRTLIDRQKSSRRRMIATSAIACIVMVGLFAGVLFSMPYGGTENPSDVPPVSPHEIGDAYPQQGEEFLAKFVNRATGRCIARNGVSAGRPDNSENPDPNNQASNIYQSNCSTGRDLSHMLVLVPIKDGWLIRSSVKINLCLQAKGSPSNDQHLAVCNQGDDRQQWIIQLIRNAPPDVVVIKNRNTEMCLGHPPPPHQDSDIRIFQYQCVVPDAKTEWAIQKPLPIGARDCRGQGSVKMKNRDTNLYVGDGDRHRPRVGDEGPMVSLATVRQSAHGCTMQIAGPSENCIGVAEDSSAVEVLWMPCSGQPNQRWVIEPLVKQNGQEWLQLRSSYDTSRCLQQSEEDVKGASLTALLCNETYRQQWAMN